MANSVQKFRGSVVPLGFIQVTSIGTPVALSKNIDANNNNAPGTIYPPPAQFPGTQTETSGSMRGVQVQGYKPAANNNGFVVNTGPIYLLGAPAPGGSGNRSDSGVLLAVIQPGDAEFFPPDGAGATRFSPYTLFLDADNNNDGGIVTAFGCEP